MTSRIHSAIPHVVILVVVLALGGFHIASHPSLSYVDEFPHYDYVEQLTHGKLVRPRSTVGQSAMAAEACRGITGGFQPPPCQQNRPYDPANFQYGGASSAWSHGPVYYGAVALTAEVLNKIIPSDDSELLTAARIASLLILAAGLSALYEASRYLVPSPQARLAMCIAIAAMPTVIMASAHVNNDGPGILVGAVALLLITREMGRTAHPPVRTWQRVAFGATAPMIKVTHVLAPALLAALVLFSPGRNWRSRISGAAMYVVPAGVMQIAWLRLQGSRSGNAPSIRQNEAFHPESLSWVETLRQPLRAFSPVDAPPVMFNLNDPAIASLVSGWMNLALLLGLGYWLVLAAQRHGGGSDPESRIAVSLVAASIAVPIAITMGLWIQSHVFFPHPNRYFISLLPIWAALLFALTRSSNVLKKLAIGGSYGVALAMLVLIAQSAA